MSSTLLSKNINIFNFARCFYGCETWPLTLEEEDRQRVFENRVLMRIFGPKKGEVTGNRGKYIMNFMIYRVSQEERTKLREGVPYVKLFRYNPKHLYPKLNGYGDNGK